MTMLFASSPHPAAHVQPIPGFLLNVELFIQSFVLENSKMLWNVAELLFAFIVVSLIIIADLVLG